MIDGRRHGIGGAVTAAITVVILGAAAILDQASGAPEGDLPAAPQRRAASACKISLVRPLETEMLYGVTELSAEVACQPGSGAVQVAFYVDGRPAGERTRPPWTVTWDAGGRFTAHLVEARLTDSVQRRLSAFVLTPGAVLQESVRVTATPSDLVELSVSITDAEGNPLNDLTAADFRVEEEGRPQSLSAVWQEERPLSVVVLIDASSSVRPLWPNLQQAAPGLASTLAPGDELKVVAFSGPAYLVQDFTSDESRVRRSMDRFRNWGGGTSLYDTLAAVGTELAWGRGGRQAVVLFTDGVDTLSRVDMPRLRNYLRRTDVVVETFLVRPQIQGALPQPVRFERAMKQLGRDTGGETRLLSNMEWLRDEFTALGRRLRDRYYLAYHSDRAAREGWRSIKVSVRRRGAVVRARSAVVGKRPVGGFLLDELRSRDPAVRAKAAEWLGSMPAAGAGEALLKVLATDTLRVREAAAVALGRLREPRAIDPLVALLRNHELGMRLAAAEGLQSFGPAAVPSLLAALKSSGEDASIEILNLLAAIGDARAVESIDRLAQPPAPLSKTAAGDLPDASPEVLRARAEVRLWALKALGRMGTDEVLPTLKKGVRDHDPEVRDTALAALVEHASPEGFKMLHQFGQETEQDATLRAAGRASLLQGFASLAGRGQLAEWLTQPIGAAIFVFTAQAASREAPGVDGGWAGLFEAVGGVPRAAEMLEIAGRHVGRDLSIQALALAAALRGLAMEGSR